MKRRIIVILTILMTCSLLTSCVNKQDKKTITIGFIPLDTRPCCYDIPLELGSIVGAKVLVPEIDKLTFFKDEGNTEYVKKWLIENASKCDALVISMEQLIYGGLIQSRKGDIEYKDIDEVVSLLKSIKKDNPNTPIYLSTVIMRTSTSVFNEEDVVWWEKINEFSNAYYRSEILNDEEATKELKKLEREIPSAVLNQFIYARTNNLSINQACIDLVKEAIVDKLLICQEDCSELGIQTIEQQELLKLIKLLALEDKISMANGTDEAGAELMALAINPKGLSICIKWFGENTDFTANYEDRKFCENLKEHLKFMNISINDDSNNVLCILVPKKKQGDYALNDFSNYEPYSIEELKDFTDEIKNLINLNKHCYILDLDCANGGTYNLLSSLGQTIDINEISGYAGWNTASNSLGTILAQIVITNGNNSDINKVYTAERILDEVIYQSIVRPKMYKQAEEMYEKDTNEKVNIYDLKNIEEKRIWLKNEFNSQSDLIKRIFKDNMPIYEIDFRWPRLFEVSIKCSGFEN